MVHEKNRSLDDIRNRGFYEVIIFVSSCTQIARSTTISDRSKLPKIYDSFITEIKAIIPITKQDTIIKERVVA